MRKVIIFLILFFCLIFLYGKYVEPYNFKIREYAITNEKIPNSFDSYKIIHFTDLYYNGETLDKMINKINDLKPDLILFTGNLLNNNINKKKIDKLIEYIKKIDSKYGIYATYGANDSIDNYNYIVDSTDIHILDNKSTLLYNEDTIPIMLIGINNNLKIEETFNYEENNYYKIIISHNPDNFDLISNYNLDLFLAGTSLNGQVRLPFIGAIYKFDGAKKYYDPIYNINNTSIYISNGLGNPKYNFRLFNTPSINFYRLYSK